MIVGDLLRLEDLRIEVAWATPELLDREVTGVTSTDLQDPARYLRPGELVLTGLVWWRPDELAADPEAAAQAAGRFATALRSAEATALLAGVGTHGAVPAELSEACRHHGIPLLAVPAGTSFRAVTDRVYLRLWGDLHDQADDAAAVPAAVRRELLTLLRSGATPSEVLTRAVTDLGLPQLTLRTAAGRLLGSSDPAAAATAARWRRAGGEPVRPDGRARRHPGSSAGVGTTEATGPAAPTVGRPGVEPGPAERRGGRGRLPTGSAAGSLAGPAVHGRPRALPVGEPGSTPFDGWLLQPHREPAPAAAAVLRGLAELLGSLAARAHSTDAAHRQGGVRVVDLLRGSARGASGGGGGGSDAELAAALHSAGLPAEAALTPVVACVASRPSTWAAAALAEALQETDAPFVVAPDPGTSESGRATGLCAAPEALVVRALEQSWPGLRSALAAPSASPGEAGGSAHPPAPSNSRSDRTAPAGPALAARHAAGAGTPGAGEPSAPGRGATGPGRGAPALAGAVGPCVAPALGALRGALAQADWALNSGRADGVAGSETLDSLDALLRGVPAEVRAAYGERLLGPLAAHDRVNPVSLLETLAVFLELDGSWSRAAQALHLHVNTVHYRVRRIEELTGRNLARLEDRADLRAALLCEPLFN